MKSLKLRNSPSLRGFRFTVYYSYRSQDGYLVVELAVSDGKFPSKKEIVDIATATFIRKRVAVYGSIGETEFEVDQFDVCITNIYEFDDSDYFNWIGVGEKLKEEKS